MGFCFRNKSEANALKPQQLLRTAHTNTFSPTNIRPLGNDALYQWGNGIVKVGIHSSPNEHWKVWYLQSWEHRHGTNCNIDAGKIEYKCGKRLKFLKLNHPIYAHWTCWLHETDSEFNWWLKAHGSTEFSTVSRISNSRPFPYKYAVVQDSIAETYFCFISNNDNASWYSNDNPLSTGGSGRNEHSTMGVDGDTLTMHSCNWYY